MSWSRLLVGGLFAIGIGFLLVPFVAGAGFLLAGFGRPGPIEREATEHAKRAEALEQEGRVDEAVVEWRRAHEHGLYPMTTRRVAGLLEQAGRFEEALAEIDREGPAISWGEYCDLRGRLLEHWKGVGAAVDWFVEKDLEDPAKPFFQEELGSFHYYAGRPRDAIQPLLEAERRALVRQRLHWDDRDHLLPDDESQVHEVNDLCDLWPTLETLAFAYEAAGEDGNAWRYATREVALHQWINRLNAYDGERWQEAGSFPGRIVRARICLRRGQLDAARSELDFAEEVETDYSVWKEQLTAARAELAERSAK